MRSTNKALGAYRFQRAKPWVRIASSVRAFDHLVIDRSKARQKRRVPREF
jgi:hypothetical protein